METLSSIYTIPSFSNLLKRMIKVCVCVHNRACMHACACVGVYTCVHAFLLLSSVGSLAVPGFSFIKLATMDKYMAYSWIWSNCQHLVSLLLELWNKQAHKCVYIAHKEVIRILHYIIVESMECGDVEIKVTERKKFMEILMIPLIIWIIFMFNSAVCQAFHLKKINLENVWICWLTVLFFRSCQLWDTFWRCHFWEV